MTRYVVQCTNEMLVYALAAKGTAAAAGRVQRQPALAYAAAPFRGARPGRSTSYAAAALAGQCDINAGTPVHRVS